MARDGGGIGGGARRRGRRAARVGAMLAAAAALAGCGFFVEPDRILPGERQALRRADPSAEKAPASTAVIPAAVAVESWPQAGGRSTRVIGNVKGSLILDRLWSRSIGKGSGSASRVVSPPVANDRAIFALDAAAQVTALALSDGDELWQADLTPENESGRQGFGGGLALDGDLLIVSTGFGQVRGLSVASGETVWTHQGTAPYRSAPAISDGVVVVVARDGAVTALRARTGERVWRVAGIDSGAAVLAASAPAISGEVVAAPFSSGDIGVFRVSDGRRGWSQTLGSAGRSSAISLIADVSSPPVMAFGRIFAGGVSGRVVAFDIRSGVRAWSRNVGAYNPVWVAGQAVYLVTADARVMALDPRDGKTIWETQLPRYDDPEDRTGAYAYGGPVMVGGKLFLTSTEELIHRLDAATGVIEGDEDLPGPSAIPPIVVGDRLYILDFDGDLHAYE